MNANTEFFFRTPWNAVADSTPIGQGTGFLTNKNLVRGFKIHASVDPTVVPLDPTLGPFTAQTIDIEIARYDGSISAVNANNFTYTRKFNTSTDNYTFSLPYISSTTPNGSDPTTGAAITGFKWWNFTFPTIVNSGTNAIPDFETATNGTVNFGGTAGAYPAWGESYARWNDPIAAEYLGGAVDSVVAHDGAAGYGGHSRIPTELSCCPSPAASRNAGGPEHHFGFGDAGVPGGSESRRHRDGQCGGHHDQRRPTRQLRTTSSPGLP